MRPVPLLRVHRTEPATIESVLQYLDPLLRTKPGYMRNGVPPPPCKPLHVPPSWWAVDMSTGQVQLRVYEDAARCAGNLADQLNASKHDTDLGLFHPDKRAREMGYYPLLLAEALLDWCDPGHDPLDPDDLLGAFPAHELWVLYMSLRRWPWGQWPAPPVGPDLALMAEINRNVLVHLDPYPALGVRSWSSLRVQRAFIRQDKNGAQTIWPSPPWKGDEFELVKDAEPGSLDDQHGKLRKHRAALGALITHRLVYQWGHALKLAPEPEPDAEDETERPG